MSVMGRMEGDVLLRRRVSACGPVMALGHTAASVLVYEMILLRCARLFEAPVSLPMYITQKAMLLAALIGYIAPRPKIARS